MKRSNQVKNFFLIIFLLSCNSAYNQRFHSPSEIISFCESVENDGRLIGYVNPDSLPSLPVGIHKNFGGVGVTIAIDSARFQTNGAFFDAYLALKIPGFRNKIAFRAVNIQFNPKGVIGGAQSRLKLVSEQVIDLGQNITLKLPGDGSNYVEWDCNGFKAVNLFGIFSFSRDLLEPTDGRDSVQAEFSVYASDISDIIIQTSISPFQIKGKDDFEFEVEDATVDLSDLRNPPGALLPSQYAEQFGGDLSLWRGFYLKTIRIKLPNELNKLGERIEIGANNLFIDESGFSGELFVDNLISLNEGSASGWGFSVENLNVDFVQNKIVGGGISGKVRVPAMDDANLEYDAQIYQNSQGELDFNFLVSIDDEISVNALNAKLNLLPSTYLEVRRNNGQFKPKLVCSGSVSVQRGQTEMNAVEFQGITFETHAPFITNGIFSLVPQEESKMEGFNISLEELYIQFSETAPVLGIEAQMNIGRGSGESNGLDLTVQVGALFFARIDQVPIPMTENTRQQWSFDRFQLRDIVLDISTNVFDFSGVISFVKNDPVYGNGIQGAITLRIDKVLEQGLSANVFFGKVEDYKYWMVDISVPTKIPLGVGVNLNKIRGGLSYHVEDIRTPEQMIQAALYGGPDPLSAYIPNREIGIGFKAGIGLDWTNETVANADVLFSITLNQHGGLHEVYFLGSVFCMVPRMARLSGDNRVQGNILVHYDNVEKILDAQLDVSANFSNVVSGNLNLHVFISPSLWFFKLNTPSNPAYVNLLDFAFIHTYLMVGQQLEPMMPPPPTVMNLVGIQGISSRNQDAILLGNGFAHGARIQVGGDFSLGWSGFAIYGNLDVGAGYDITLYNYGPGAHCEGSNNPIGMRGWYLQGQIYAYIGFALGIRGKIVGIEYDLPLLEAYIAMYLAGKLPKPTYVEGGVGVRATLIGLLNVNFNLNFSLGDNCNIITT